MPIARRGGMWYYGERTPRRCGMNILMLEDDPAIAQGLRYSLESEATR